MVIRRWLAKRDLVTIWHYIAQDHSAAANEMLDRIEAKFTVLAEQPLLGSPRSELRPGLRSAPVGNYTIFYRPIPQGIRVVRVLHASQDIARAFRRR